MNEPNFKWAVHLSTTLLAVLALAAPHAVSAREPSTKPGEPVPVIEAVAVPVMPPGFHIEESELSGQVFANAEGKTLYIWPQNQLRNGYSGEAKGQVACYDEVRKTTAGLMSPYPPGVLLPELDTRPSCTDLWPPVLADEDAVKVGKWTVLTGDDGRKQWAYDEQPLYTSVLDTQPGDTYGDLNLGGGGDSPAYRQPAGPAVQAPPNFKVNYSRRGLMLTTNKSFSVYSFEKDTPENLACVGECTQTWIPVLAPELAKPLGKWSIINRAPGVKQWAFDGQPLYTYVLDGRTNSQDGSDVQGWHNVYIQKAPPPPAGFSVQITIAGSVLADPEGKTIYLYNCGDDSIDQLSCDHPDMTQVYRLAICGGGDPDKCMQNWPYVIAEEGATSISRTWTVMQIDPATGHKAEADQEGSLSVWAYRDRPVYTYAIDKEPGDVNGDGIGEWRGQRNGLKAFWLRSAYFGR